MKNKNTQTDQRSGGIRRVVKPTVQNKVREMRFINPSILFEKFKLPLSPLQPWIGELELQSPHVSDRMH